MVTVADRLQEALPLLRHFFQGVQLRERGGRKWLYAVVPAKAATNSLSLLVCFPLPDRYPLEPPQGFFLRVREGEWRWMPIHWVNWQPGNSEREGSCLLTFLLVIQRLLSRLLTLPISEEEEAKRVPPFQRGQIFWHGTSLSRAHSILVWGFQPQGWYGFGEGRIYFAPQPTISWGYAQSKGNFDRSGPALLKCLIDLTAFQHGRDYQWQGNYLFFRRSLPPEVVIALFRVLPDGRRQRVIL